MSSETEAAARQAHIDIMNSYFHALDTRDWQRCKSLFTEDMLFQARMLVEGQPGPYFTRWQGMETFVDNLISLWTHLSATHHLAGNHVLEVASDGRSAKGSCNARAYHVGAGPTSHLFQETLGRFDFETVQVGVNWKIRSLEENIMLILGTPEVFGDTSQYTLAS